MRWHCDSVKQNVQAHLIRKQVSKQKPLYRKFTPETVRTVANINNSKICEDVTASTEKNEHFKFVSFQDFVSPSLAVLYC